VNVCHKAILSRHKQNNQFSTNKTQKLGKRFKNNTAVREISERGESSWDGEKLENRRD